MATGDGTVSGTPDEPTTGIGDLAAPAPPSMLWRAAGLRLVLPDHTFLEP